MGLRVGLVGLPNVGKSTLFNALSQAGAVAANYPFATVEPNVGVVPVPDDRLEPLAAISSSAAVVPTSLEIVDIAGLVAGASQGEGLGNQFLAHIREVDALCHVVRCFRDDDVIHVAGEVDAASDIEVVRTELALKDLETVERRLDRTARLARAGDRSERDAAGILERLREHLSGGAPARTFHDPTPDAPALLAELFLLTSRPVLFAVNVGEGDLPDGGPCADAVRDQAATEQAEVVVICAEVEAQLVALPPAERSEYLAALGLERSGLERLIAAAYRLLGLITFLTTGPKETRAWTVPAGTNARRAAREIHSDIERGFIRAEVSRYEDLIELGSEAAVREAGRLAIEGRDYELADGDVVHFRFNV